MIAAIASQGPDYAGEGRERIRTTDVLRAVRYLPRDHCRAERSLSTVVGRLDAWIIQETQQVAPVMVPTEFVLQPPVVRIRHGTVAEMIGRLSSQPLGLGGKVRRVDFLKGGAIQLSQMLTALTKEDPSRFANLVHRIPDDANPVYFEAILQGIAESTLDSDSIVAACLRCHGLPDRPLGRWITRPLHSLSSCALPPRFPT